MFNRMQSKKVSSFINTGDLLSNFRYDTEMIKNCFEIGKLELYTFIQCVVKINLY